MYGKRVNDLLWRFLSLNGFGTTVLELDSFEKNRDWIYWNERHQTEPVFHKKKKKVERTYL